MSNLNGKPIYWSKEDNNFGLSYVPGVDIKKKTEEKETVKIDKRANKAITKAIDSKPKQQFFSRNLRKLRNLKNTKSANSSVPLITDRISLKDLCPEDKKRVANLICELAKAGEEKQASENALNDERKQFALKLNELKSDKDRIEQEQRSLLSEFKECQRLLVFYQQKIAEEQKEVARDINRLLAETSLNKSQKLSPSFKATLVNPGDLLQSDSEVIVRDGDNTINSQQNKSVNTDFHFPDVAGNLGESFRPQKISLSPFEHATDKCAFVGRSAGGEEPSETQPNYDHSVQEITNAFEQQIRALSPNGRRLALLRQKHDLEEEQAHLQKLLSKQEDLLKFRQAQLKKRHFEYTKRMNHYKKADFLSSCDGREEPPSDQAITDDNQENEKPTISLSSTSTPRIDIGSPRRRRSPYKSMFKTEPLLRSRKLHLSSSESAFNDQTSLTYNTFPCNSSLNSNRSTERRCRSEKSQSSSDVSSKINGASNLWLSRSRETAGKSRLRSDTQRCFAAEMSDSSVARTDRKFNSTRQVLRNTMNNINTLSDLVSTVETSQSLSASLNTTPLPSRSPLSNAMVSVTFDPEDSQLLEDIFFIN